MTRDTFRLFILFVAVSSFFGGCCAEGGKTKVYYLRDDEVKDFQGAQQFCVSKGRELASITSLEEQDNMEVLIINKGLSKEQLWIGGYYSAQTKRMMWLDPRNPEMSYAKWQQGGHRPGNNKCVMVSNTERKGFRWRTEPCGTQAYFICQQFR